MSLGPGKGLGKIETSDVLRGKYCGCFIPPPDFYCCCFVCAINAKEDQHPTVTHFPFLPGLPLRTDSASSWLAGCLHTEPSSFLQTPPVLGSSSPLALIWLHCWLSLNLGPWRREQDPTHFVLTPQVWQPNATNLLKLTLIFKNIYLFLVASCLSCSKQDLCSRAFRFSCPTAHGILVPQLGIEPMSPILQVGFSTIGPPGKTLDPTFCFPVSSFSVCKMQTGR